MAEASEPGRPASAGSGSLEEGEEDGEREPLLPRVAWAQRRTLAPGGAVRLEAAAAEEGAASPSQASDRELLPLPLDASFSSSPGLGRQRSSPTSPDRNRPVGSGATRPFPTPAPCQSAPVRRAQQAPPRVQPRLLSLSPASPVGKTVRQASRPEHRPRVQLSLTPWSPRLFLPHPHSPVYSHLLPRPQRLLLLTPEVVIKLRSLGPPLRVIGNFWNQTGNLNTVKWPKLFAQVWL